MKNCCSSSYLRLLLCIALFCFVQATDAQTITIESHATQGFVVKVNGSESAGAQYNYLMHLVVPTDFADMVFDENGYSIMDELYVFLDLADYGIPEFKYGNLTLSGEVYLKYLKLGNSYKVDVINSVATRNFTLANHNGKKLYFTGTCTAAFAGDPTNSDIANRAGAGVFYLQGHTGEKVDIYLHNFNMQVQDKQLGEVSLGDLFKTFTPKNMASVFAIGSPDTDTKNPFTANFHICGENTLTGGNQSLFSSGGSSYEQVLANILTITNSPIAIIPMANTIDDIQNTTARVVFDDEVPVRGVPTKVNGKLNLPLKDHYSTPSIDLGNGNGFCEFNGGQYRFATPASNSMFYVCSMTICYKQFTLMGNTIFGIGSSVGTSTTSGSDNKVHVVFNDGTFSTYSAEEYKNDYIDVLARGWYQDYTDLRVSYESRVNGGTFNNCRVYRCDASGERGISPVNDKREALCYKNLTVPASAEQNGALSEAQVANIPFLKDFQTTYGTRSLTPLKEGDEYKLYVYLPLTEGCDEEIITKQYVHNWVTVIPKMGADRVLTMGGDVQVYGKESDGVTDRTNGYLFYARLNEYTKEHAYVDFGPLRATVQMAIDFAGNREFSSVVNPDPYNIEYGLYTMLSFNTNQWYMLTMPYDVANIYVIETTETQKQPGETHEDFLKRQGEADGNLASTIITSLCPDIFSGKGSGVLMSLMDIIKYQLPTARVYPLVAYDGTNADKAHFYLYEQKPDDTDEYGMDYCYFSTNADDYGKKWQYAQPESFAEGKYKDQNGENIKAGNILMRKGHVYSLLLPDTESSRYWDGKYLIFEGYGPQDISGRISRDYEKEDFFGYIPQTYLTDDMAVIQGNATFSNDTVPEKVYLPFSRNANGRINYEFIRTDENSVIKPCEVTMVLSPDNTDYYKSIQRPNTNNALMQKTDNVAAIDNVPKVDKILLVASAVENAILLRANAGQIVHIYTIDGRLLYSDTLADGSVVRVPATAGVYLVKGQEQIYKLIVP